MYPTVRVFSARAHTPLIRFLGKRNWPSGTETPHAHPAAPAELQSKNFANFSNSPAPSSSSSSKSSSSKNVFSEFWEAPERLWKRELDEAEIDAILSGGASLR